MSILDKFSTGFKNKAIASIKIQDFIISKNELWEDIKTWNDKYSFDTIFYAKRWLWEKEKAGTEVIIDYFIMRFNISNIADDISNISEDMRIEKNWMYYTIDMIDFAFSDHVVLKLTLIK